MYDGTNLKNLYTASNADYVYWWNASDSTWRYYTSGSSTYENYTIFHGEVAHFYSTSGTTWFRNITNINDIYFNLTGGHNYVGLFKSYNFANISNRMFTNQTGGNTITGQGNFSFDYFASYNNSNQLWASHIYGWAWNNLTYLGLDRRTGLDALWVYSNYNMTINTTGTGWIASNNTGYTR
jgi:hypothetical protein